MFVDFGKRILCCYSMEDDVHLNIQFDLILKKRSLSDVETTSMSGLTSARWLHTTNVFATTCRLYISTQISCVVTDGSLLLFLHLITTHEMSGCDLQSFFMFDYLNLFS